MIVVDEEIYSILESISRHRQMRVTALIDQILSALEAPR
jgi:predicted DNA-binding ribbon-helix-helix protein